MQDGQLCLLSPGEGGGHIQFSRERKKQKQKTSWVECGASRVEERGGRWPESIALLLHIIEELSCSIRQMIGIYHERPDYK